MCIYALVILFISLQFYPINVLICCCCVCGQGAVKSLHHSALGDIKFCRRCDTCSARSTKRAVKVSALTALRRCAGNIAAHRPSTAVPKDPTKTLSPKLLRAAHRSLSFRRGKQRIGGTGAVLRNLSFITVQYSSSAVQQYLQLSSTVQQKLDSAAVQHLQCSAATCTSTCSGVLCSLHHSVVHHLH